MARAGSLLLVALSVLLALLTSPVAACTCMIVRK
jgi:hypothetical protein